ncbi:MAG: hypothetical protein LUC48_01455 [Clostridiales bacterium]|nr:hypothetical protein [Clostridiales bacterium]
MQLFRCLSGFPAQNGPFYQQHTPSARRRFTRHMRGRIARYGGKVKKYGKIGLLCALISAYGNFLEKFCNFAHFLLDFFQKAGILIAMEISANKLFRRMGA